MGRLSAMTAGVALRAALRGSLRAARRWSGREGPGTVLAVMTSAVVLAGCAAKPPPPPPPPKPTELIGVVQAAANLNPSVRRRPSPLLIRIYELKTATAFNSADFVALYQRDQAELGAEMVTRDELVLNPGDSLPWLRTAAPQTRFIGVFAAYRDLDRATWRSVVAVQPNQTQRVEIRAGELAIQVTVAVTGMGPPLPAPQLVTPPAQTPQTPLTPQTPRMPPIPLPALPKAGVK